MGVDRSQCVDRTYVGNPRKRNQRKQMVQLDRQSVEDAKPAKCRGQGGPQQKQAQARRPALLALCATKGLAAAGLAEQTPQRGISTAARETGLDTETGQQGTEAAGHPTGRKSSRRNGRAPSHRTDFRADLRSTELRIPARTR